MNKSNKYKEIYNYESDLDLGLAWEGLEAKLDTKKKRRGFFWLFWGLGSLTILVFSGFLLNNHHNISPLLTSNENEIEFVKPENTEIEAVRTPMKSPVTPIENPINIQEVAQVVPGNVTNGRNSSTLVTSSVLELEKIKQKNGNVTDVMSSTNSTTLNEDLILTKGLTAVSGMQFISKEKPIVQRQKAISTVRRKRPVQSLLPISTILTILDWNSNRFQFSDTPILVDVVEKESISKHRIGFDIMFGGNIRSLNHSTDLQEYANLRKTNERMLESSKYRFNYDYNFTDNWLIRTGLDFTAITERFKFEGEVEIYEEGSGGTYTDYEGTTTQLETSSVYKLLDIDIVKYNKLRSLNLPVIIGYKWYGKRINWIATSGISLPLLSNYNGKIFNPQSVPLDLKGTESLNYDRSPKFNHGFEGSYSISNHLEARVGLHIEYDLTQRVSVYEIQQKYTSIYASIGVSYSLK